MVYYLERPPDSTDCRRKFERHLRYRLERECDIIAAYLLVPCASLEELGKCDMAYLAVLLDVLEILVELRCEIYARHGK